MAQDDLTYIPDGYTYEVYIAPQPGLHGSCKLTCRLIMNDDLAVINAMTAKKSDPRAAESVSAFAMQRSILAWNVTDDKGRDLEITAANILRLHPALYRRLYRVLVGQDAGDMPPTDEPCEQTVELLEEEFRQAMGESKTGN